MTDIKLSLPQKAAMLALMAAGKEVSNSDLKATLGFTLTGGNRTKLNDHKFVASRKVGQTFHHELTDNGWAWCTEELSAVCPPRAGSAGGALYAMLAGLGHYLKRSNLTLADVFVAELPAPTSQPRATSQPRMAMTIETRIRHAYKNLAREPKGWVSLTDLRAELHDVGKADVDATLKKMIRLPHVYLVPESNQKALTAKDRAAAVFLGGENLHLLAIEES